MEAKRQLIKSIDRFLNSTENYTNYYYACLGAVEVTTALTLKEKDIFFDKLTKCGKWGEVVNVLEELKQMLVRSCVYGI